MDLVIYQETSKSAQFSRKNREHAQEKMLWAMFVCFTIVGQRKGRKRRKRWKNGFSSAAPNGEGVQECGASVSGRRPLLGRRRLSHRCKPTESNFRTFESMCNYLFLGGVRTYAHGCVCNTNYKSWRCEGLALQIKRTIYSAP